MSKSYRPYEPEQMLLLPPSLKDWLPAGHLAHFVSDMVETLDLSTITIDYEREERGQPPFHPVMMTKILVYAYCVGITSSRKLARALQEDVAFRMLASNNAPDFRTIADFRLRHLQALRGFFQQVLELCAKAGMVKLAHVAIDGTKIKANASKQRSMSYAEMIEKEKKLQAKIAEYLRKVAETDAAEDELYGSDKRGDELPEELQDPKRRLERIKELKADLEREAKEAADRKDAQIEERRINPTRGRWPKKLPAKPKASKQRNLTDRESRLLPSQGGFIQGYNCQAAVDDEKQVIVGIGVEQGGTDAPFAGPMIEQIVENLGSAPKKASMDAGYFSTAAVDAVESYGCEAFIATDSRSSTKPGSITARMRSKLDSAQGRAIYRRRQCIVEPVFGQIKQGRGFRQFLLRGLRKVEAEWSLICTGHNLLKLWRSLGPPGGPKPAIATG